MLKEVFTKKNLSLKDGEKLGIYGTGLAGKEVFEALDRMRVGVDFFLDGDPAKTGLDFCGKEIRDIVVIPKDSIILIAANPIYRIHERLEQAGIKQWEYVDPVYLHLYSEGVTEKEVTMILKENETKIYQVYKMLSDEKSKKVFASVLKHRVKHDLSLINEIYDENQYFGNDIIPVVSGNFVDCGAYIGDTLRRFLKQDIWKSKDKSSIYVGGGINYHYYALEAEKQNYETIVRFCEENAIGNVTIHNIAVCDKETQFSFLPDENDKKVGGKLSDSESDSSVLIQGNSIDNILGEINIDMITMDIEGAEIQALYGARQCITRSHPKLAISAYHAIEHLWEIPLLIKELNPDYQIFYRHHCWNMCDTVCYAL